MPWRIVAPPDPPPAQAPALAAATALAHWQAEVVKTSDALIAAQTTAFKLRCAREEADDQQQNIEDVYTLDGRLDGKTVADREAQLRQAVKHHPDYGQWTLCRFEALAADIELKRAEVRYKTALTQLRAATAAVAAVGVA